MHAFLTGSSAAIVIDVEHEVKQTQEALGEMMPTSIVSEALQKWSCLKSQFCC